MISKRRTLELESNFPNIVCLCGSARFYQEFQQLNMQETLVGKIVLSIANFASSEAEYFAQLPEHETARVKAMLDDLHRRKIELADEIFIINKDGYMGESTKKELEYANSLSKTIRWLEPV